MKQNIRTAAPADLPALTAIYNHYIETTAITFDTRPFEPAARQAWFDRHCDGSRHQLLVVETEGQVAGYASSGPLRPKPAYDTSVETTIYLAPGHHGMGMGRALYSALLQSLAAANETVHRCYGIVTQPNEPSMALHRALGFTPVAHLNEVGFKFDRYWDAIWMEYRLD